MQIWDWGKPRWPYGICRRTLTRPCLPLLFVQQQLNGGEFTALTDKDWDLILPYLEENERLFGVKVDELLTIDGQRRMPAEVYRKIAPIALAALAATVDVSDE